MRCVLPVAAFVELVVCCAAWSLAFAGPRKKAAGRKIVARAPVSRWGIILEFAGIALVWAYVHAADSEKSAPSLRPPHRKLDRRLWGLLDGELAGLPEPAADTNRRGQGRDSVPWARAPALRARRLR